MKENDIVKLINFKEKYRKRNLYEKVNGVILKSLPLNKSLVLFLNDKIIGDYAVVEIDNIDLKLEDVKLPIDFIQELKKSDKLKEEKLYEKQEFKVLNLAECDVVELLIEDEKYSKFGIHKGDVGVVAIDYATNDSILVDFSRVDKNGKYYGDCISVKIQDLKIHDFVPKDWYFQE